MPLLWLIPRSKDGRFVAIIAILGLLLFLAGRQIVRLNAALDAKPKIVERVVVETKIVEKRVAGPVVIREHVVTSNGVKTIERTIEKSSVVTDRGTEIDKDAHRTETPIGRPEKLWTGIASFNPKDIKKPSLGLRRSFGLFDLGYSHDVGTGMKFEDGHHINLGIPLF